MSVKLISKDLQTFEVPLFIKEYSSMIKESLDSDNDEVQEIPLLNVDSKDLKKIIKWVNFYHNDSKRYTTIKRPLVYSKIKNYLGEWYIDFLEKEVAKLPELSDMIKATDYMGIEMLLEMLCLHFALMIKGKTDEEIKEFLKINKETEMEKESEKEMTN
jgi:S-phase kinase-associated protein 1